MWKRGCVLTLLGLWGAMSTAVAQPDVAEKPTQQACEQDLQKDVAWRETITNELRSLVGIQQRRVEPGAFTSSIRDVCMTMLASDLSWRSQVRQKYLLPRVQGEVRDELRVQVHTEDAQLMLRNRKHVVMMYAALWVIVAIFTMTLWLRQRSLRREIGELEDRLRQAMET